MRILIVFILFIFVISCSEINGNHEINQRLTDQLLYTYYALNYDSEMSLFRSIDNLPLEDSLSILDHELSYDIVKKGDEMLMHIGPVLQNDSFYAVLNRGGMPVVTGFRISNDFSTIKPIYDGIYINVSVKDSFVVLQISEFERLLRFNILQFESKALLDYTKGFRMDFN